MTNDPYCDGESEDWVWLHCNVVVGEDLAWLCCDVVC